MDVREVQEAFLGEARPHRVGREQAGRGLGSLSQPEKRLGLSQNQQQQSPALPRPGACWASCRRWRRHSQEAVWAGHSSHRCLMETWGTPPAWGRGWSGVGPATNQPPHRCEVLSGSAHGGHWALGPPSTRAPRPCEPSSAASLSGGRKDLKRNMVALNITERGGHLRPQHRERGLGSGDRACHVLAGHRAQAPSAGRGHGRAPWAVRGLALRGSPSWAARLSARSLTPPELQPRADLPPSLASSCQVCLNAAREALPGDR